MEFRNKRLFTVDGTALKASVQHEQREFKEICRFDANTNVAVRIEFRCVHGDGIEFAVREVAMNFQRSYGQFDGRLIGRVAVCLLNDHVWSLSNHCCVV